MAVTQLADIIEPEVWLPYVQKRTTELDALARSGIVVDDPELAALAQGGGTLYNMPFWNDLSGTSDAAVDNPATESTPAKIGAGKDKARKHFRGKSWSWMDLAGAIAGDDPAMRIADLVAGFWARERLRLLILTLKGVLADNAANDSGDMIFSIANDNAGAVQASEKISSTAILLAAQTMGDASSLLTAIAMHSVLHTELDRQKLIVYDPTDPANVGWGTYAGKSVIVDDTCPAEVGSNRITYTSYLFGRGAVGYGRGTPKVPVETFRNPAAGNGSGQETLYTREEFILHPRGIAWTEASVAGATPSDAEIATAANWNRVYDRKLIRLAVLKTNG
jgi:hypothetical protein